MLMFSPFDAAAILILLAGLCTFAGILIGKGWK
jgi:hypothetical protein